MATLYIDRKDGTLSASAGVITLKSGDPLTPAQRFPISLVERIVIRANTHLDSATLCALSQANIGITAIGGRTGDRVAQTVGAWHSNASIRVAQILAINDKTTSTALAARIVRAKLVHQKRLLQTIQLARPDLRKPTFDAIASLTLVIEQATIAHKFPSDYSLNIIRGFEGAGAAAYFGAFFQVFAPALGASHRTRRPPTDPVNAAMSLGYTLLYSQSVKACWMAGLDPAIGALHSLDNGRASLACDLMEPWRAQVDRWVWHLFRSGELRAEHFGFDGAKGCLLGKAGRGYFYRAWELHSYKFDRQLLAYARALAKHFELANSQ
jgi:CRISP-associated protein Cas1